jgi:hypothetical protein
VCFNKKKFAQVATCDQLAMAKLGYGRAGRAGKRAGVLGVLGVLVGVRAC